MDIQANLYYNFKVDNLNCCLSELIKNLKDEAMVRTMLIASFILL